MFSFQQSYKICKETEKYCPYRERGSKGKQSTGCAFKETQILDLLDKYFNSAILNVFKELKKTMCKELKEL